MPGSWAHNRLTDALGLELPIVLGPFGGASSSELVAEVSNAGGLGSYGLYGLSPQRIKEVAAEIRGLTPRSFALNLWLPMGEAGTGATEISTADQQTVSAEEYERYLEPLKPFFGKLGLPLPAQPEEYLLPFSQQIDAAIEARPAALSFVYGVPDAALVQRCSAAGIRVIGTATTLEEAIALDRAGVDAIVATGFEAAGHRVSFMRPAEESLVGTMALVPRVVDAVHAPVIAAGGIADGRGVAASLALGACAAQLGTAFLACDSSAANLPHRRMLWSADAEETVLTDVFSGRLARGIPNRMSRALATTPTAPFPVQNWLTSHLKRAAAAQDNAEATSLWAGQAVRLIRHHSAPELIETIVRDVDALLH